MPILGFTGLPGHGKSYGVVANVILPALRKGRTVVTNIPINRSAMRSAVNQAEGERKRLRLLTIDLDDFTAEGGKTFAKNVPDGAVVVLDELWRLWPSGLRADKALEDHKSFLAEHRHRVGPDGHTMEIVLVTQDLSQVAAFAKVLVEKTYQVAKLKELGATNLYSVSIYAGCRANNSGGQLIGKSRGKYDPQIFKLYKSHTKSDAVGVEADADSRGTIWSSGVIRFGGPAFVLFLIVGFFGLRSTWEGLYGVDPVDPVPEVGSVSSTFSKQEVIRPDLLPVVKTDPRFSKREVVEDREPGLSRSWRIAGTIIQGDVALAYLIGRTGYRYFDLNECELLNDIQQQYSCIVDGERVTSWSGGKYASVGEVLGTPGGGT